MILKPGENPGPKFSIFCTGTYSGSERQQVHKGQLTECHLERQAPARCRARQLEEFPDTVPAESTVTAGRLNPKDLLH